METVEQRINKRLTIRNKNLQHYVGYEWAVIENWAIWKQDEYYPFVPYSLNSRFKKNEPDHIIVDKIIMRASLVECLLSPSRYIRESKKWLQDKNNWRLMCQLLSTQKKKGRLS